MTDLVIADAEDGVATITLDRPRPRPRIAGPPELASSICCRRSSPAADAGRLVWSTPRWAVLSRCPRRARREAPDGDGAGCGARC